MTTAKMEKFFIGAQLQAKITVRPDADDDAEGQETLDYADGPTVEGVAEASTYSANAKGFTTGLTFHKDDSIVGELAKCAGKSGLVVLERTGDATGRGESEESE